MERLTKKIHGHVYYTKGKFAETIPAECEIKDVRTILRKLAAYEDTGLEPEQIKSLNKGRILLVTQIEDDEKIINDLTRAICTKTEEIESLKSQLAECKKAIGSDN